MAHPQPDAAAILSAAVSASLHPGCSCPELIHARILSEKISALHHYGTLDNIFLPTLKIVVFTILPNDDKVFVTFQKPAFLHPSKNYFYNRCGQPVIETFTSGTRFMDIAVGESSGAWGPRSEALLCVLCVLCG